jgi:hypothetical protein
MYLFYSSTNAASKIHVLKLAVPLLAYISMAAIYKHKLFIMIGSVGQYYKTFMHLFYN